MTVPETAQTQQTSWKAVIRLAIVAGLYFSLHAITLTIIPEALRAAGHSPTFMGVAVGLYVAAGMILDIPISRFAQRVSLKISLIAGALGTAILLPLYAYASASQISLGTALILVFLLGACSSALQGPVLGGLASAAGARSQLQAQSMNATVQRLGGLGASVIIGIWLPQDGLLAIALIGSIGSIGAAIFSLGVVQHSSPRSVSSTAETVDRSFAMNRDIGSALIGNVIIQTLLIVGYSFFPTYIEYSGRSSDLGWLLGIRESGAILAALLVLLLTGHRVKEVRRIFLVALGLTAFGLLALPGLPFFLIITVFALQGAVIGIGIVLFNLHIFIGSNDSNRITVYGMTSAVGRLSGVLLPLLAGYIIGAWIDFFPAFIGGFLGLLGLVYLVFASRGQETV